MTLFNKIQINVVSAHAEGEVGDVIISGVSIYSHHQKTRKADAAFI